MIIFLQKSIRRAFVEMMRHEKKCNKIKIMFDAMRRKKLFTSPVITINSSLPKRNEGFPKGGEFTWQ